jgi:hypothetical protein
MLNYFLCILIGLCQMKFQPAELFFDFTDFDSKRDFYPTTNVRFRGTCGKYQALA